MKVFIKNLLSHHYIKAMYLICLSLTMALAIIFYHPDDPSFNTITDTTPENYLGIIGSYLADLLNQYFGVASWVLIFGLFNLGVVFIKDNFIRFFKIRLFTLVSVSIIISLFLNFFKVKNPGAIAIHFSNYLIALPSNYQFIITLISIFLSIGLFIFALGYKFSDVISFINGVISKLRKPQIVNIPAMKVGPSFSQPRVMKPKNTQSDNSISAVVRPTAPIANEKYYEPIITEDEIFKLPDLDLLSNIQEKTVQLDTAEQLQETANELLQVLNEFGVKGKIIDINQGPVVTLYEFEPAAGTKSSRVIGLADDIARSLCAVSARIAVVPGRNVLGIELPNKQRQFFRLRELIETKVYNDPSLQLPIVLGKDLAGRPCVADLAKMPHLLVAGTTGSGKSVGINTMILSLLYRYTPKQCRFIMIDPKMLELSVYDNIPHLLSPVVTEPGKAVVALKWAVKEMENRYRLMANLGVRNIQNYNNRIEQAIANGEELKRTVQTGFDVDTGKPIFESVPIAIEKLPYIVIIVDEMADLMLVAGKDIESSIQRLAQMARAAGLHLIMATQRPSVDVITGVIKANFPSRISFKVTSKIDSRTILGEQGSEQLLGMGDMLYMGNSSKIIRVHGPFVADDEVEKISRFLKDQGTPDYVTAVTEADDEVDVFSEMMGEGSEEGDAGLYRQAVQIVKRDRKASTSYIQRCLRIGYNRAAILIEKMEKDGVVSPPNHSGKREILVEE